MFSVLKKFTKNADDRCSAPTPMSSSLQKKFSRGVHFNMKILIKGDRNVGKSCLFQRLQGGPFIEEYVPTEQIQVAPIHWTYKNTDFIVKVEVWEVVDKGRTKKKPPIGLKLENQTTPSANDGYETPVLDATFLDVYKNASGVILMLDITKPWTFEYVVKELTRVPADLPVVVLGNHCDMQHHRQIHPHHIDEILHSAKRTRSAPIRYAESSMRNGFGLRLLHKFFCVPFLRLQKTSLLEQLQRNQQDMEEIEKEIDDFQNSEESHYTTFVHRLVNKRRVSPAQPEVRPINERSPSIVLGAGKPIIPPSVNPLLAQSLAQPETKVQSMPVIENFQTKQSQYVSPEFSKLQNSSTMEKTSAMLSQQKSEETVAPVTNATPSGVLEEFYAGTLDSSFLEEFPPIIISNQEIQESESEDDNNTKNPMVTVDEDDLDITDTRPGDARDKINTETTLNDNDVEYLRDQFNHSISLGPDKNGSIQINTSIVSRDIQGIVDPDFADWIGDSSARRSPEGGEDPEVAKETSEKTEKRSKKKKSKHKDRSDGHEKSDNKEKKHKHKKSKTEKASAQSGLLAPVENIDFSYEEYESI